MLRKRFVLVIFLCLPASARAQHSPSQHEECRSVLNKLRSDPRSEAFRWSLAYGSLNACGAPGATVMADVLRERSHAIVAAGYWDRFVLQAASNRHPVLFEAGIEVAADRSLPTRVRIGGIQIALGQYDIVYWLPRDLDAPVGLPNFRFCAYQVIPEYGYQSMEPLPNDHRTRLLDVMRNLARDAESPTAVRRAADCVDYILTVAQGSEP